MSLTLENLRKRFYDQSRGEILAVDNVSFSCTEAEVFGLLGLNGAGKTTTLRMVSTVLAPDSGTITINGHDTSSDRDEARRHLGFLPSDGGLYERLTPHEILTYFGRLSGYPKERLASRIAELLKLFEIEGYANTRCAKLSTGTKQKVSLARAIVHDPQVMILDEPTSGLDVLTTQTTHRVIREWRNAGKCILFSTHIMSEAEKLCDRIAIIHKGQILALGTLPELRETTGQHYLEDVFVATVQEKIGEVV